MSTHNLPLSISKRKSPKFTPNAIMSAAFLLGIQERVRNGRRNRAISVRATEGLLYNASMNNLESFGHQPVRNYFSTII